MQKQGYPHMNTCVLINTIGPAGAPALLPIAVAALRFAESICAHCVVCHKQISRCQWILNDEYDEDNDGATVASAGNVYL